MSKTSIPVPFQVFHESDGDVLDNGYIYIGTAGTDPVENQINVYFDKALTIPAAQPLRTINGYISNSGTPASIYTAVSDYSITVKNKNGRLIYTALNKTDIVSSDNVIFDQVGTGAQSRSVEDKLLEIDVSVTEFGAVGDGLTDDLPSIQAAFDSGAEAVFFPSGTYLIKGTITFDPKVRIYGEAGTMVVQDSSTISDWCFAGDVPSSTPAKDGTYHGGGIYNMDIRGKYGLRINNVNTAASDHLYLANPPLYTTPNAEFFNQNKPVVGFDVHNCVFMRDKVHADGVAIIEADPLVNDTAVRDVSEYYASGCGVQFSNVYEGDIRNCTVKHLGIGVYFFGADISSLSASRVANCLRHVHVQQMDTAGYQVEVSHCDFLDSYSRGGVYVDTRHALISNNYFENEGSRGLSDISLYIVDEGASSEKNVYQANRFDDYGQTVNPGPLMHFGGLGNYLLIGNRVQDQAPAAAKATITVDSTNWGAGLPSVEYPSKWGMIKAIGNLGFPVIENPYIQYALEENPLHFSPSRTNSKIGFYDTSGGGIVTTTPYTADGNGRYYYKPALPNAIKMYPEQHHYTDSNTYKITIKAATNNTVVAALVKYVEADTTEHTLFNSSIQFNSTTSIEQHDIHVTDANITVGGYFVVYLDYTKASIYSIDIEPNPRPVFREGGVVLANQTGDGTAFTFANYTEELDIGQNFNANTGVFTVPQTGLYSFEARVAFGPVLAGHTSAKLETNKNSGTFQAITDFQNPANNADGSGNCQIQGSDIMYLNKGDTIALVLTVSGSTKTVGSLGVVFKGYRVD